MVEFAFSDIVWNLLLALRWTALLSVVAFIGGGAVGLLVLLARLSSRRWLRRLTRGYIEVFQGTPLLMQLFLTFFGLSLVGLDVPAWLAAGLALTLFTSAFLAEIWRGCVEAVPRGQWEASSSLALTYLEQMRWVILPQALRLAVAPTIGFSVQVVKGTAVTSIIGFVELTKAGTMITNATFQPFLVYGLVALFYFLLCFPLSLCAKSLERKFHAAR
ncbi:amino acid ABC transporter permease [Insolitispirillum peregrinum]|uniref:Amino acid ABC transporter membrane protein 2, PAAT family n=1 Tax=Insolitispirillum peregrinum TaxID=80876 RepID=A0A1N7MC10_9PROT|nr:amino acid ABC transporter permease [Insolitispirillum peregrinum]SIS83511.1 amino acid ABC transporter membrane protein 2, PAAT family [Insolitispirillum peregrinum]